MLSCALAAPAFAQRPAGAPAAPPAGQAMPAVVGTVVADNGGSPLPGATVTLRLPADSSLVTGVAADGQGRFVLRGIAHGVYLLEASFVGYVPLRQTLRYDGRPVMAGELRLREDARSLGQVSVEGRAIIADQRGDTLAFDARQFQVNRDATAEDLVRRIPGASVDESGQLQIQGQAVQRVTLDGRDLFGGDAASSLRNLPAELVSQVETFEGLTDASRFSGFDDGERVRTVNLVSRANMRNTAFGRAYGGFGNAETYQAGLNVNVLQGQRRLNVVAQSNNIGQQNFAFEDLIGLSGAGGGMAARFLRMAGGGRGGFGGGFGGFGGDFGVAPQNGIATTHALGLNYSDRWSRRVEVTGSYFGNQTDNTLLQIVDQQFVSEEFSGQRYDERTQSEGRTVNHRLTGRLNAAFGPETALQLRPRMTTQMRRTTGTVTGVTQNDGGVLSEASDAETARSTAVSFSNELLFRHRWPAARRTVSFNLSTTYTDRDREQALASETNTFRPAGVILIDQTGDIGSNGLGFTLTGTLSQSFGQRHAALLSATLGAQETESERLYFDLLTGVPVADSTRSARLQSGLTTYRAGTGYRFRGERLTVTTTLDAQLARQARTQTFPFAQDDARSFLTILPTLSARYEWSRTRNLNLNLRATTNTPSIEQLDSAVDVANALQVSRGNPDLSPETRLSGGVRFLNTQFMQGRTFIVGLNGDYSFNPIGTATTVVTAPTEVTPDVTLAPGGRLTQPQNLDGRYAARMFTSVGMPVRALRSNLNATAFVSHSRTPSRLNGEDRATRNTFLGPGLSLTSNISPQVDFSLGTNSAYTIARSNAPGGQDRQFLTQTSRAALNVELPWGTVFRTDALHQTFAGIEGRDPYLLWNASLGQRLLPGRPAELRLAVTDILNQNANYNRTVTDLYVQGTLANTLQRYVQLVLTYTVRPSTGGRGGGGFPF